MVPTKVLYGLEGVALLADSGRVGILLLPSPYLAARKLLVSTTKLDVCILHVICK